jgi:putative ABC transport system permease protein
MRLLLRASVRHLARRPWQVALSVLGIALGVAVVLAVDLATESARRSFRVFADAVAGRATHQVLGGPAGLPEDVYRRLRVEASVRQAAPIVERTVAAADHPGVALHLLGVDPLAEGPFRDYATAAAAAGRGDGAAGDRLDLDVLAALLTRPGTALLPRDTAARLGLAPGDALALRLGVHRREITLAGVLVPRDPLSARALESLLVTDVATAQELTGLRGRLSRIDLLVPPGAEGQALLARVAAVLPPGARVVPAGGAAEAVAQLTRAFAVNLAALSLLALVVGMFLVYNTATFSVVQRREALGTLRALGVSRRQVFALVLGEALLLGAVATALGLPLGVLLGQGLVGLVTRTINDLYVTVAVTGLAVPAAALAKAALLGVAGTVLAALGPALEATGTAPRAVQSRAALESRARRAAPRLAVAGLALAAGGAALLAVPGRALAPAYAGVFALLLGAALLTPAATVASMRAARPLLGAGLGLVGRMAAGAVVQALSRTGVALAALMVALAATVGVGIMIESFRDTVVRWLAASLQADVYVSAPSLVSNRPDATLDPGVVARVRDAPGVARVNTIRTVRVDSTLGPVRLLALDADARGWEGFLLIGGNAEARRRAAAGDAALVSEPLAARHGLRPGVRLDLRTDRGPREIVVAGVYRDYGSSEGAVLLSRAAYDRLWEDPAVSSLGVYARPGTDAESLAAALRGVMAPGEEVIVRSNRALREASLDVFDRTFAVTVVLRWLATLVAFVGVLSALTALVLERARELGVLRAQGLTAREVWGLVLSQTGLMGLVAGLLALPVGCVLAVVLVFVINQRSFGWTLELSLAPAVLGQAVALAVGAALLAGFYPAYRISRLPLPDALRDE